ncbi:MAG: FRG domain-containing protein, partial [Ferrovibrio sp.]
GTEMTWQEYRSHVDLLDESFVFRGQQKRDRLRTTFHRSGRANLFRFLHNDLPFLHRQMSSRTTHIFQLSDPDQFGAFCWLAQHHGYPTPLLDWTYSPFVAAYFAYRRVSNKDIVKEPEGTVRIFKFNRRAWSQDNFVIPRLTTGRRHFSFMDFLPIENERARPQQAVSSVTNMDDIEWFVSHMEKHHRRKYLEAIDLPLSERPAVMRDLARMGITAAALFPGLDGICEEVRERHFSI